MAMHLSLQQLDMCGSASWAHERESLGASAAWRLLRGFAASLVVTSQDENISVGALCFSSKSET
jgi:hypothetical protein